MPHGRGISAGTFISSKSSIERCLRVRLGVLHRFEELGQSLVDAFQVRPHYLSVRFRLRERLSGREDVPNLPAAQFCSLPRGLADPCLDV